MIPGSDPLYAPGNETPAGLLLPPPVTWSWTQLLKNNLSAQKLIRTTKDCNLHVELSTRVRRSDVETNGLTTQKVLASGDAAGDLEGKVSTVVIDGIGCPPTADKASLVDFEPFQASDGSGLRIGDFGHIYNLRARVSTSIPLGGGGSASSNTAERGSRSGTVDIANLLYC